MRFETSDEHSMMQSAVTNIAENYDEDYWREVRTENAFPAEIYQDLADGGWLGTRFPEEYGGQGMGMLELVHVIEALGREGAWIAASKFLTGVVFGGSAILAHGSEEQKERYLPGIIDGEDIWALGVTESEAGVNTSNIATAAERNGDEFVVQGNKQWISELDIADYMLLLARTTPVDEVESPYEGLTMFVVDPADDAIEYSEIPMDIYFPETTFQVHIDDLVVNSDQVLGTVDEGLYEIFDVLNTERIASAMLAWSAGKYALDKAVAQAQNRTVWDEPIGAHQGIQHPLAEAYANLELAKHYIKYAAWQYDEGVENPGKSTNLANLSAAQAAWDACEAAMTTFGGSSVSAELGIAAAWGYVRHLRIVPVPEEMLKNYIGHNLLDLPRSY